MYYHTWYSLTLLNCNFYNNSNGAIDITLVSPAVYAPLLCSGREITFTNIAVYNTTTDDDSNASNASVSIQGIETSINIQFTNVNFTLNHHSKRDGRILLITNSNLRCTDSTAYILFLDCSFNGNTAFDNIVDFQIIRNTNDPGNYAKISLLVCGFNNNSGGSSILNIRGPTIGDLDSTIKLDDVTFSNNKGTALHCNFNDLMFEENITFANNTAVNGAAIYFEEIHSVQSDNADIKIY